MKLFADRLRALGGGRVAIVVGVFLLVALAAGASSVLAGGGLTGMRARGDVPVPRAPVSPKKGRYSPSIIVGRSVKNDVSRPLRLMPAKPIRPGAEHEASPNPQPVSHHKDVADAAHQTKRFGPNMPSTTLNFDGILFPGVSCNCAPPDTNGEVGATQYVQMVNTGFQVFNKTTGASVFGPVDINTVWTDFGGVCEAPSFGDPVVLYDQLANRWLISQFAGASVPTDECIAVSTGVDAAGTWNRYDFHLGTDFFDYPHLGVWPDAYYMTMNVFNAAGNAFLGPQPFAFDRDAMLAGDPATFVTTRAAAVFNSTNDGMLPGDLDGSTLPPAGAPNPFLMSGTATPWKVWRFHADFTTPASTTFTLGGNLTPAGYSVLCPTTRSCVPQLGTADGLDGIGDRAMFRLAYRNLGSGNEALVGNQSVSSGGVAGIRWFEINHATSGTPVFTQQSTYQPDTTWRWMGSAAMDRQSNLAVGFSASSASINPQIRYAGRLAGDPVNTLAQGEAHLFDGTGSQTGTSNRWGDYSDLTVDPVDDCTFWYTTEYYSTTGTFSWRTRIGNFKFPSCTAPAGENVSIVKTADASSVDPGDQIGFNVTLTNSGADPATGLAVTDNLPGGTDVNWSVAAGSDAGWSITGSAPNQSLTYAPTTLAGVTSTHVHVVSNTTANSCGDYDNTASFVTGTGNGSDSASASVNCLDVTKTADAANVIGGQQIGYTVTVTNNAPGDVSDLSVTDPLPAGTGVNWSIDAAGSSAGWSISGSPPNESLVAPTNLLAGQSTHVHVVSATTSSGAGTYGNTASATSSVGSESASASTTVVTSLCSLSQGFNDVSTLPGWFMQNNSDPPGTLGWFQGAPGAFPAQGGATNSYIAGDFENVDSLGPISNWLLTPVLTLKNGTQLTFWTRKITETGPFYPDRLQVRMSTSGARTDVGSAATDVGVFTRLLLDINPTYSDFGYPMSWTKYTLTLGGVTGTTSGRIAFRYFVEDGGFFGARSDYVGIDTAAYTCTPPPPPPPPAPPPPPPPPPHSLAVLKTGTGAGTVTSSPAGVNCGATCVATFLSGTNVTLTATPAAGSRFASWSGDCTGTSRTCSFTMTSDRMAVATFNKVIRCKVPKVVGLTLKKARARIVRAHCRVGKITKKFSTRKKKGKVLAQKPKPGRLLAAGARVNLIVGKGPRR
jgi:uncharacterized repeat protein (TIGR01451 family)